MLLNSQLAFESSRPIKDEEYQQAQAKGFTLSSYSYHGIAIAVNPNLNIPGSTTPS